MKKILDAELFNVALVDVEASYAEISRFYGSDRRTGHRWQTGGPSNQTSRLLQVLLILGVTLDDIRALITYGQLQSKSPLPKQVIEISEQVAAIKRELRAQQHSPTGLSKESTKSHDTHRSQGRAPKKTRAAAA